MDEQAVLERLVTLRKERPKFTRMISWEIISGIAPKNRCEKPDTGSSGNENQDEDERPTQNQSDESDSDSEYFSAEEEILYTVVDYDDADESSNVINNLNDTTEGFSELNNRGFPMKEHVHTSNDKSFSEATSLSHGERKRSLSKRQKKNRRDKWKEVYVTYADYYVPFRNVEDVDIEVSDLIGYEDDIARAETRIRSFPTLLEVCLRALSRQTAGHPMPPSTTELPGIVKGAITSKRRDQSFSSIQLSWLYRLLGCVERRASLQEDGDSEKVTPVLRKCRNIWDNIYETEDGSTVSAILPYSYVTGFQDREWKKEFTLLSVIASVIDLMLPKYLPTGRLRHSSRDSVSEAEAIRKTTDALVHRIKENLRKRYPHTVKHYFDDAVPYVFWTRGNIKFAAEGFVRLSLNREGKAKAMLLCEAARLYAQTGEAEKAQRLFREASDSVLSIAENHQLILQKFMLMANVHDQGPMTSEKMVLAAESWKAAMKLCYPKCPWTSPMPAVESFLCFHGGWAVSKREHLEEAVQLMEELTGRCDILFLHLSLAKAMLGDVQGTWRALHTFRVSSLMSADMVFPVLYGLRDLTRKVTPWQPLLDHVGKHGIPDLIKVMWRTQLGHLRLVNIRDDFKQKTLEADLRAELDLMLRLTDDGFLTADLQMVLPPIRALNLDPYTGLHQHASGLTHEWHSLNTMNNAYNGSFLVPTLTEVYHDQAGNRVHILCQDPGCLEGCEGSEGRVTSRQFCLFWTGADGQRARLNLHQHIIDAARQSAQRLIEKRGDPNLPLFQRQSRKKIEETSLAADFCHKRGYSLTMNVIDRVKQYFFVLVGTDDTKRSFKQKKKLKTGKAQKKAPYRHALPPFEFHLQRYQPYKDTLYLLFSGTMEKDIQVFVDCTDRSSFLEPVVTTLGCVGSDVGADLDLQRSTRNRNYLQDEILLKYGEGFSGFVVFGKKGEVLTQDEANSDEVGKFQVYRKLIFNISEKMSSVICNPVISDSFESDPIQNIQNLQFGGGKVLVVTETQLHFLRPDCRLKHAKIIPKKDSKLEFSEDNTFIKIPKIAVVRILEERKSKMEGEATVKVGEARVRLVVGIDTLLVVLEVTEEVVEVVLTVQLCGRPAEVYTINQTVGFLVTTTCHRPEEDYYQEHLFHYRHDGQILAILPFLGPGPRCFCVAYLPGKADVTDKASDLGKAGQYVFMRDGHDGIIGIRL